MGTYKMNTYNTIQGLIIALLSANLAMFFFNFKSISETFTLLIFFALMFIGGVISGYGVIQTSNLSECYLDDGSYTN